MIFAVFDPSPLTVCINCSFCTFIRVNAMQLYKQKMSFADSVLRENNQTNSLVISEKKYEVKVKSSYKPKKT